MRTKARRPACCPQLPQQTARTRAWLRTTPPQLTTSSTPTLARARSGVPGGSMRRSAMLESARRCDHRRPLRGRLPRRPTSTVAALRPAGRLHVLPASVSPGPVEVHADVARKGHRVHRPGAHRSERRRNRAYDRELRRPRVEPQRGRGGALPLPAPDESIDLSQDRAGGVRFPAMPGWQTGQPTEDRSAEFWIRFTDGREPGTLSLPLLVDGAAPVVLELGVAGSAALELTTPIRQAQHQAGSPAGSTPATPSAATTKRTSNSGTPTATWSPKPSNSPSCWCSACWWCCTCCWSAATVPSPPLPPATAAKPPRRST